MSKERSTKAIALDAVATTVLFFVLGCTGVVVFLVAYFIPLGRDACKPGSSCRVPIELGMMLMFISVAVGTVIGLVGVTVAIFRRNTVYVWPLLGTAVTIIIAICGFEIAV